MPDSTIRVCSWPMPVPLHALAPSPPPGATSSHASMLVHVHGCAVSPSRHNNLTLLATADALGEPYRAVWGTEHLQQPMPPGLVLSVDGQPCTFCSRVEVNLLRFRCARVARKATSIRVRAWLDGGAPSRAVTVPLQRLGIAHGGLHCSSSAMYGHMPLQGQRLRAAHKAWRGPHGLNQSVSFARSPRECCEALPELCSREGARANASKANRESVSKASTKPDGRTSLAPKAGSADGAAPPLLCFARRKMDARDLRLRAGAGPAAATSPSVGVYYDQAIHLALCLLYAQMGGAQVVAAADTDELPSRGVHGAGGVLARLRSDPKLAGAHIFFDAALSCPATRDDGEPWCPSSEAEYEARCGPLPPAGSEQRSHTKPVVVPSRVGTLKVHTAKARPGMRMLAPWEHAGMRAAGAVEQAPCLVHQRIARCFGSDAAAWQRASAMGGAHLAADFERGCAQQQRQQQQQAEAGQGPRWAPMSAAWHFLARRFDAAVEARAAWFVPALNNLDETAARGAPLPAPSSRSTRPRRSPRRSSTITPSLAPPPPPPPSPPTRWWKPRSFSATSAAWSWLTRLAHDVAQAFIRSA